MKDSLRAVLAEAKSPEHCCKSRIIDQLTPIIQAVLAVQKQIAKERELRVLASIEDPTYDGNVEKLEQTDRSMERRCAVLIAEARGLRDDFMQKERYAGDVERDVIEHAARGRKP